MPVIAITLLPGYGTETEARLVQRVALPSSRRSGNCC